MKLRVSDNGNGLPGVDDLVYCSANDSVYCLISEAGPIQTGGPGGGNWQFFEAESAGGPSDYDDDEWEEVSDCRVEEIRKAGRMT